MIWSVATHTYVEDIRTFAQPLLTYLMHAVAMTSAALVLVIAARRGGPSVRSYLALTWPRWRYIAIGLALVAVSWSIFLGLSLLHISPDPSREAIREYQQILGNPWALTVYWLLLVGTAPVAQEIIFRGFVLRGWSASFLGGFGSAVLIAFAWAVVQPYNVPATFVAFCLGLICGVMRWRSGSTVLAIMMHMAWNGATGVYYAYQAMSA